MSETNQQTSEEKQPTPEEVKAMRAKMLAYYNEQLPLLSAQAEVEKLQADIEESRARRILMINRQIEMTTTGPDPDQEKEPDQNEIGKKPRSLKKEKV